MGFKSFIFALLLLVTVLAIAGRAIGASSAETPVDPEAAAEEADAVEEPDAEGDAQDDAGEPGTWERIRAQLPAVSEAGVFGLLAFALAYLSRSTLRLVLLGTLVGAGAVWGLVLLGVLTVDGERALQLVRDYVLNVGGDGSLQDVAAQRLPTVATAVVAYACGWRRG